MIFKHLWKEAKREAEKVVSQADEPNSEHFYAGP